MLLVLRVFRIALRILFTAVLFSFVFPKVAGGVQFHGQFWPNGVIDAAVFAVLAIAAFRFLIIVITAASGSDETSLLKAIPLYVFAFWILPTIQLVVFGHIFPEQLTVVGWISALWAGFLLLLVNILTLLVG
jgi:hypothetical protein